MQFHKSARLFASTGLLALAACSSGGGGTPDTAPPAPVTPQTLVTINGAGVEQSTAPTLAIGATPNFTTSLPPVGTSFPLTVAGLYISRTSSPSATPPNSITVGGRPGGFSGTATFQGTVSSGGVTYPVIGLNIPSLNINATGLKGDGTIITQTDGSKVGAAVTGMTYTLLGAWTYQSANGNNNAFGLAVTGYQTPNANVPTTGTASYIGNSSTGATAGGVVGTVIMKSGSENIAAATLSGNVNLNVNFATQEANGTLSNMTAKDVISGATSPWNNVTLTGKLSATGSLAAGGAGAYLNGTAQAQAAPAGATFGTASTAYGSFGGALYGPNASEVGASWSLNDNGKVAVGIFGATKQ